MFKILGRFFKFCGRENEKKFILSILLGVVKAVGEAMKISAIMVIIMAVMDNNITNRTIYTSLIIMAVSFMLMYISQLRYTMLQTEGGYNAAAFKRIELARHLRYLPMGYFNRNSLGEITSVTTNTMENLANVATRVVMMTTGGLLNTAIILIFIIVFDWRIGLIGVVGTAIFLMINSMMQNAGKKISADKVNSDTELVSEIMEYVQGISEVKSYNLVGSRTKKLNSAIERNAKISTKLEMCFIPYVNFQNWITKITGAVMMLISVYLYINGDMKPAYAVGMTICAFMLYAALEQAGCMNALLHAVDVCVNKATDILELPAMDIEGRDLEPENHNIDIDNVTFSYDNRKIIDGISLHIPEKTTTAIVGPSGGGKTTLCNLISRFWDVDSGSVCLGGVDVREYSMDSLMKNFSFVFQNVYLFADTIANNIRFGRDNAAMDEVIAAAKRACCHEFIMSLPEGYDTVVGEGGATLSGGEKQRISIARAIMKDAPVIILDEATANVDPENEKELTEAIEALTKEKTIIMIAHRLKTVRNADCILVVDKGRIVEKGRHEELVKHDGIYKKFVQARELAVGWKL